MPIAIGLIFIIVHRKLQVHRKKSIRKQLVLKINQHYFIISARECSLKKITFNYLHTHAYLNSDTSVFSYLQKHRLLIYHYIFIVNINLNLFLIFCVRRSQIMAFIVINLFCKIVQWICWVSVWVYLCSQWIKNAARIGSIFVTVSS